MIETARYPSLRDRAVLVTGGADGIGAAIVQALAEQGAIVGFVDIDEARARALLARLDAGAKIRFAHTDVRDIAAFTAAIDSLEEALGGFRVLVNNAGNDRRHTLADLTPDAWDERLSVNLRHMVFAAKRVAPGMAAAGGGAIVNLGSTSWMKGAADLVAYATAKSAVAGLTKSLARELGPNRIRVNCIAPDRVLTDRQQTAHVAAAKLEAAKAARCLPDVLEPEDVARLALWLAADDSRLMTGQTVVLDAGAVLPAS